MKSLILMGALLLLSMVSFSQMETITIKGKVTNQLGESIPNATIDFDVVSYGQISKELVKITDFNGEYSTTILINREKIHFIQITCSLKESVLYYSEKQIKEIYINTNNIIKDTVVNFVLNTKKYDIQILKTKFNQMTDYSVNQTNTSFNSPGNELRLYTKHLYIGTSLSLVGGTIGLISTRMQLNGYDASSGLVIGGIISLIGVGFIIEAPIHIRNAGIILNQNGVGLKVPIK
jgi:hypothetical protein